MNQTQMHTPQKERKQRRRGRRKGVARYNKKKKEIQLNMNLRQITNNFQHKDVPCIYPHLLPTPSLSLWPHLVLLTQLLTPRPSCRSLDIHARQLPPQAFAHAYRGHSYREILPSYHTAFFLFDILLFFLALTRRYIYICAKYG